MINMCHKIKIQSTYFYTNREENHNSKPKKIHTKKRNIRTVSNNQKKKKKA